MIRSMIVLMGVFLVLGSHLALAGESEKSCPRPLPDSDSPVGEELGRGGGVVVCRDQYNSMTSIELFDYWEQRTLNQLIHCSPNTSDPVKSAKEMLYLVRKFSPQRALAYEKFIGRFMGQVEWTDDDIEPIKDVCSELRIPKGCAFDQLIVRRDRILRPGEKLFLVNRRLWNAMIVTYQAGAIMHEAFYEEAIRAGHAHSRLARYFNVLMHSNGSEKMTDLEYAQVVKYAAFPFWEFRQAFQRSIKADGNDSFSDEQLKFNINKSLSSIDAREGARLELFHPLLGRRADSPDSHDPHYSLFVKRIVFSNHGDGEIVRAQLDGKPDFGNPYVVLNGQQVELALPGEITISKDSTLRLKLAGCYRDPASQRGLCGDVTVNPAGIVRESR